MSASISHLPLFKPKEKVPLTLMLSLSSPRLDEEEDRLTEGEEPPLSEEEVPPLSEEEEPPLTQEEGRLVAQEEERLTQLLTDYYVQAEQMSEKVRHLGDNDDIYKAALAKWERGSIRIPPANDEKKRAEYFRQCNEICSKEPKGPEDRYIIIFAIYAAMQVIVDQDFLKVPRESRGRITAKANRLSLARIRKDKLDATMKPQLPAHLVPVYFPKADVNKHGSELIGSTIRYHDGENGKTMECTVCDLGTSYLKGDWFLVRYDDDTTVEIKPSDMVDILKNRVE